jgi:hypothetical protein
MIKAANLPVHSHKNLSSKRKKCPAANKPGHRQPNEKAGTARLPAAVVKRGQGQY